MGVVTGNAGRAVIFKSAVLENLDRQMVVLSGVGEGEAVPGTGTSLPEEAEGG